MCERGIQAQIQDLYRDHVSAQHQSGWTVLGVVLDRQEGSAS